MTPLKNYFIGALATILIAAGCLIAFPGRDGQHMAGLVLIIAGLHMIISIWKSGR